MSYQSLYRRYRSQRFDEVLGQDHVTTALRNAVREDRVGQGYLFSGPRGTGKTSTARILAKVLNCEHPVDGEPDTTCERCVAVQTGRSVDWLHELDAASNNGVDAMRDLIGRAGMGTSGARKVYILDEVHMLTQAAANTLLKTLEEPPDHVVFVLATTEPEKVLATIRSRTQHFEFHLLPGDVLADHVRHVIADAGLGLGEDAVDHVVRVGRGSARDTLSALDQVAAAGGVLAGAVTVDDIVDALGARDAGAALIAVDAAIAAGREPRMLATALVETLRHAFLAAMGAPASGLTDAARDRADAVSRALGPASLTRALEAIGAAVVDMRQAPDARIPLEVALIQIARPEIAGDLDALVRRVESLERAVASGTAAPETAPSAPAPTPGPAPAPAPSVREETAPPPAAPSRGPDAARARLAARDSEPPRVEEAETPAPGSRPTLGAVKRARAAGQDAPTAPSPSTPPSSAPPPAPADPAPPPPSPADSAPPPAAEGVSGPGDLAALTEAWDSAVLDTLKGRAKALYKSGRFVGLDGNRARFAVPNEHFRNNCVDKLDEVHAALDAHFGQPVRVEVVVDAGGSDGSAEAASGPAASAPDDGDADQMEESIDVDELTDAPDAATGSLAKLQDAFPGAELLEDK